MQQIQELMRPLTYGELNSNRLVLPPIVKPKFPTAKNCVIPACESCMLARARKRPTNVNKVKPLLEKEEALSWNKLEVGQLFQLSNSFARLLAVCQQATVGVIANRSWRINVEGMSGFVQRIKRSPPRNYSVT